MEEQLRDLVAELERVWGEGSWTREQVLEEAVALLMKEVGRKGTEGYKPLTRNPWL